MVKMRDTSSLKAYIRNFNIQMNVILKMDEFAKKYIFLAELQKWVVDASIKFPKFLEDVARIIKIAERIKANGLKKNK